MEYLYLYHFADEDDAFDVMLLSLSELTPEEIKRKTPSGYLFNQKIVLIKTLTGQLEELPLDVIIGRC